MAHTIPALLSATVAGTMLLAGGAPAQASPITTCTYSSPAPMPTPGFVVGSLTVRCTGDPLTARITVGLQKRVNGHWRDVGTKTTRTVRLGRATVHDSEPYRSGYWRAVSRVEIRALGIVKNVTSRPRHL